MVGWLIWWPVFGCLCGWLIVLLVDLVDWLVGWLAGWLVGCLLDLVVCGTLGYMLSSVVDRSVIGVTYVRLKYRNDNAI